MPNLQDMLLRGTTLSVVVLVLGLAALFAATVSICLWVVVSKLKKRLAALARNSDGVSLEEAITSQSRAVDEALRQADVLEQAVGILQAQIPHCIQRVNLVRYDAFEDVGGEQSFAVALIDATGDGILLSSIYTRQDVRIYAKSVNRGQASHNLSDEERQALSLR